VAAAHELIYRPLRNPDGPPQPQVEYKLRRFVNDYLAPPKTEAKLTIALETFERASGEIARMGARTPHELMRCAEVTFIRDCAELAARASLVRTESRWGLYHDRPDHPGRDDAEWLWHLNVRRDTYGVPQFLKRAVAPYIVPVSEFTPPVREVSEVVLAGTYDAGPREHAAPRPSASPAAAARPPRLLELLRLAEIQPSMPELEPYLRDPDARVRRAAIAVLTETAPTGAGLALAGALGDGSCTVRHAAAAGLRELVQVLPAGPDALRDALHRRGDHPDPVVRCAVLDVLREIRAGDAGIFAAALADGDHRVRSCAVRGLVSAGEPGLVIQAAGDRSREVRVGVADGLALLGRSQASAGNLPPAIGQALELLAGDPDPLVRAATFKAAGAVGCPPPLDALAARALTAGPSAETAWQARAGAAQALAAASAQVAAVPLAGAASDPHPDVRKAAVIALASMRTHPAAAQVLRAAADDSDADVRAYARQAGN